MPGLFHMWDIFIVMTMIYDGFCIYMGPVLHAHWLMATDRLNCFEIQRLRLRLASKAERGQIAQGRGEGHPLSSACVGLHVRCAGTGTGQSDGR